GFSIPDCLAEHPDNYAACDGSRSAWLPRDPTVPAVIALNDPAVTVADLTDHICRQSVCPAATGGVPVYFDASHLTSTYAKTLAPYLEPYLARAVKR
ncbi:MAG: SGNH hydrolase domain-containing protein, partial [Jatrophihabitans sp.]